MIAEQYEPTDQMFTVSSRLKEEASVRIEQYRDTMEKYYTENFYMPLERYLVQYKILEERITQRNTRLVDMDRYNSEVKALMSKQDTVPTRLQVVCICVIFNLEFLIVIYFTKKRQKKKQKVNDLNILH